MIELLVVMLIVAILGSAAIWSVASSRASGRYLATVSATHAYAASVEDFARDHHGRFPGAPGTSDWPGSRGGERGPAANVLGQHKYYLRAIPEPVQDGSVRFGNSGDARITYRLLAGGRGYEFSVRVKGRETCVVRGGQTTGAAPALKCSRR